MPALDELLTPDLLADSHADGEADAIVYYAMEVLATLQSTAALSIFLRAYRQVDDDMVEGLEDTLRRLGPDSIGPLADVAADPQLTYYARALAANGAVSQAGKDPALRALAADRLRPVLAEYVERPGPLTEDDQEVVAALALDLAELADPASRPLIEAAFAAGLVTSPEESPYGIPMLTLEDVESLYDEGVRDDGWRPRPFLERYREDWRKHQEEPEAEKRLAIFDEPPAPQPIVLGPKLGRNDPCWCGSGRKYKKCHLAQDEKDKVRL